MKTLADVRSVTATLPPRLLIHGQEGTGKTRWQRSSQGGVPADRRRYLAVANSLRSVRSAISVAYMMPLPRSATK